MRPVNKKDLAARVAEDCDISQTDANAALESVLGNITASMKAGEEVKLLGFGSFYVTDRAASQGRNPRTGETIQIAASRQPKFKAGKPLKDAMNS